MALGEWAGRVAPTLETRAHVLPDCYRLIAQLRVEVDLTVLLSLQSVVKAVPDA
jgi:hypothetical protein